MSRSSDADHRPGAKRPRRLRRTPAMRRMVRETRLQAADLILPLFVTHGDQARAPIDAMPGVARLSISEAVAEAERARASGVAGVLLFGIPARKDAAGREAYAPHGIVQETIRAIKKAVPDLVVITDVCLCSYTDHGHCGLLPDTPAADDVLNDATLPLLARIACTHAVAGADIVAPSAMMDHMVAALRQALDAEGHHQVSVLSYSAKYASAFYGPFREAASGAPQFGDRRTYQMDPSNAREALREVALDVDEGADMLMIKPALAYLDIIRRIRDSFPQLPLVAYNVSGEYAMLKAAAAQGVLDEQSAALEILRSIRRAGADLVITYYALDAAQWLKAQPL